LNITIRLRAQAPKKRRKTRREVPRVRSEEWRKRRGEQERNAGRWSDGTARMDQMWENFYWVLPGPEEK
jgi:hypothetical protein